MTLLKERFWLYFPTQNKIKSMAHKILLEFEWYHNDKISVANESQSTIEKSKYRFPDHFCCCCKNNNRNEMKIFHSKIGFCNRTNVIITDRLHDTSTLSWLLLKTSNHRWRHHLLIQYDFTLLFCCYKFQSFNFFFTIQIRMK